MDFTLRAWTILDLDSLVIHANNWQVAKNLTDKFPFPLFLKDSQNGNKHNK